MASQKGKKKNGKASDFNWTDDEIQLLLEVCFDFKAESDYEGVNWESKRMKYEQIKSKFCEQYPEVEDEKFPRCKDLDSITKERVSAKLKSLEQIFQRLLIQGKEVGEEGSYSRFMKFVKEFGVVLLPSIVFHTGYIHQLLKKKHRKLSQCKTNYRMKKMMTRDAVFNQTRYFQNMMKPVLEAHQVVKKLEKPNPLKSKRLTVEKR